MSVSYQELMKSIQTEQVIIKRKMRDEDE